MIFVIHMDMYTSKPVDSNNLNPWPAEFLEEA